MSKNDGFTWFYDKPLPYYLTPQAESALGPDPDADEDRG